LKLDRCGLPGVTADNFKPDSPDLASVRADDCLDPPPGLSFNDPGRGWSKLRVNGGEDHPG